jgi:hypothetical protein
MFVKIMVQFKYIYRSGGGGNTVFEKKVVNKTLVSFPIRGKIWDFPVEKFLNLTGLFRIPIMEF